MPGLFPVVVLVFLINNFLVAFLINMLSLRLRDIYEAKNIIHSQVSNLTYYE